MTLLLEGHGCCCPPRPCRLLCRCARDALASSLQALRDVTVGVTRIVNIAGFVFQGFAVDIVAVIEGKNVLIALIQAFGGFCLGNSLTDVLNDPRPFCGILRSDSLSLREARDQPSREFSRSSPARGETILLSSFAHPWACRPFPAALPASPDTLRLRLRHMPQLVFQDRIERGFIREKVP
jgi:hypothetical protein